MSSPGRLRGVPSGKRTGIGRAVDVAVLDPLGEHARPVVVEIGVTDVEIAPLVPSGAIGVSA